MWTYQLIEVDYNCASWYYASSVVCFCQTQNRGLNSSSFLIFFEKKEIGLHFFVFVLKDLGFFFLSFFCVVIKMNKSVMA